MEKRSPTEENAEIFPALHQGARCGAEKWWSLGSAWSKRRVLLYRRRRFTSKSISWLPFLVPTNIFLNSSSAIHVSKVIGGSSRFDSSRRQWKASNGVLHRDRLFWSSWPLQQKFHSLHWWVSRLAKSFEDFVQMENDSVSAQLSIKSPNGQRNAKSKAKPNGLAHKS